MERSSEIQAPEIHDGIALEIYLDDLSIEPVVASPRDDRGPEPPASVDADAVNPVAPAEQPAQPAQPAQAEQPAPAAPGEPVPRRTRVGRREIVHARRRRRRRRRVGVGIGLLLLAGVGTAVGMIAMDDGDAEVPRTPESVAQPQRVQPEPVEPPEPPEPSDSSDSSEPSEPPEPPEPPEPVAPAAADVDGFTTPSGNITCRFGDDELDCRMESGLDPPPAAPCPDGEGAWTAVSLGTAGRAEPWCPSDPPTVRGPILAYGAVWSQDGIVCESASSGLRCENATGGGLFLSRSSWEAY